MKLICPDCGKQYDSGKFCQECGAKLQEVTPELVCPSCGYKAKSGKFCPECGTKLVEQVETPKNETSDVESPERAFNERDPRFAKYYDKKGFPRAISQEERAIAKEDLMPYVEQNIAEAKMLLGFLLLVEVNETHDQETGQQSISLFQEAEEAGDKFAYYMMGMLYVEVGDSEKFDEAEKRLLECYQEYQDGAGTLALLYTCSEEKCDYKKAFEYATIAAEDDEPSGYQVLGALYLNGWGVEKDLQKALENYQMAAALGDETSMNQIGYIYLGQEEGGETVPDKAFYWFNEATKKGNEVGMYNLGCCYRDGVGVEEDAEQAAEWFKKSADLGYVSAMKVLAEYYQEVLVDDKKAKMWYLKAAEAGDAEAQNSLGITYANEGNYPEAIKWYQKAIELGYPMAYRNLAICYRDGKGVNQSKKKAEDLLTKASELGCDDADEIRQEIESSKADEQLQKANLLLEKGKNKDAIAIYKKLAEEGNTYGQERYGNCLLHAIGIKQNIGKGIEWLEKSASQKSAWACMRLVEAYIGWSYNGKSAKTDLDKAKEYLQKAINYGADSDEVNKLASMAIPTAEISKIKVRQDVSNDGNLGFEVVFDVVANGVAERQLNFTAYCLSSRYGNRKVLNKPASPNAYPDECCYTFNFKLPYSKSRKLFIPYKWILNTQQRLKETLFLMVWDITNGKKELLACEELTFFISYITHMFRSNEWSFKLLGDEPITITIPLKSNPLLLDTMDSKPESSSGSKLSMDDIRKAADASYAKEWQKKIAVAVLKIAEVIQERLPDTDVSYMVHPSEYDPLMTENAIPIHFLFKKNGTPKVAVVAVTDNGCRTFSVMRTQTWCEKHGIKFIRVYADGFFADWITGWSKLTNSPVSAESVEFCKNWLVEKISKHL